MQRWSRPTVGCRRSALQRQDAGNWRGPALPRPAAVGTLLKAGTPYRSLGKLSSSAFEHAQELSGPGCSVHPLACRCRCRLPLTDLRSGPLAPTDLRSGPHAPILVREHLKEKNALLSARVCGRCLRKSKATSTLRAGRVRPSLSPKRERRRSKGRAKPLSIPIT